MPRGTSLRTLLGALLTLSLSASCTDGVPQGTPLPIDAATATPWLGETPVPSPGETPTPGAPSPTEGGPGTASPTEPASGSSSPTEPGATLPPEESPGSTGAPTSDPTPTEAPTDAELSPGESPAGSPTPDTPPTGGPTQGETTPTPGLGSDADGDGWDSTVDCDDQATGINPAASERCNGADDDCDGLTDEGLTQTFYRDADLDGWGDAASATSACRLPLGYSSTPGDCDDADDGTYPGAPERCDGIDNNCDGAVDEGVQATWYRDQDGDGVGGQTTQLSCTAPEGYTSTSGDCNDANSAVYPGAPELCDGQDNNCNSQTDEVGSITWYKDGDGDGYGKPGPTVSSCSRPAGYAPNDDDCDDANASVNPAAREQCDSLDNNCDGQVDEGLGTTWYKDGDGDTWGGTSTVQACVKPSGYVSGAGDCNDGNAAIHPGATEVCDGVDNNCSGSIDEGVKTTFYQDSDADGFGGSTTTQACNKPSGYTTATGDCNDGDKAVYPGATELCDAKDNDCDGSTDEGVKTTFYQDSDADGFGTSTTTQACSKPTGYAAVSGDCNDGDKAIYPGATELCDGKDNDCDGSTDEGLGTTWYKDNDQDGYGASASGTTQACSQPSGYAAVNADCNDADATTYPGATELCDSRDNDCDSQIDEGTQRTFYRDQDLDTYGDPAVRTTACSAPTGYVSDNTDCDDTSPAVYPGAAEIPANGVDEDCDGEDGDLIDLDQDGWPDLIVTNQRDNSTASVKSVIYFGGPTGLDAANMVELPTIGATSSCVADFDSDGWLDVVFANQVGDNSNYNVSSYLYWGSAAGFSTSDRLTLATIGATSCLAGDFDVDGDVDLAFANRYDGSTFNTTSYVYYNVGATFSASNRAALPTSGAWELAQGDLNDDGYPDLIFSCNQESSSDYTTSSWIYWGSASGFASGSRQGLETIGARRRAAVADLNDDGALDVVFGGYLNGSSYAVPSYAYLGPAFSTSSRITFDTRGAQAPQVADFNRDGELDLLFPSWSDGDSNTNSYIYYGPIGTNGSAPVLLPHNRASDAAVADIDLNGFPDVVLAIGQDNDLATSSRVFYADASGVSTSGSISLSTTAASSVAVTDMDLDGWPDIAFGSNTDGDNTSTGRVYYGSPRGPHRSQRTDLTTVGAGTRTATADLNKDGHLDVVIASWYGDSGWETSSTIFWGSTLGPTDTGKTSLSTRGASDVCIADLNADTWPDLVFANYSSNSSTKVDSYIYWGGASGFSTSSRTGLPTIGASDCNLADVDKDGDLDILLANEWDSSVDQNATQSYIYLNVGGAFSTSNRRTLSSLGAMGTTVADLNKDGYNDIIVANREYDGEPNQDSYVYWGSASGWSDSSRTGLTGHGPVIPAIVDNFNGDSHLDILLVNTDDGDSNVKSYVYLGNSTTSFTKLSLAVRETWGAAVADLNKDGITDIVLGTTYDGDYVTRSYVYWGSSSGPDDGNRIQLDTNSVTDVGIGDLNLDGWKDIVFATWGNNNSYSADSYVYYGGSAGYSASSRSGLTSVGSTDLEIVDLDKDGRQDVVLCNMTSSGSDAYKTSYIYWNTERGLTSSTAVTFPTLGNYHVRFVP